LLTQIWSITFRESREMKIEGFMNFMITYLPRVDHHISFPSLRELIFLSVSLKAKQMEQRKIYRSGYWFKEYSRLCSPSHIIWKLWGCRFHWI